jgi:hypothetical protein
MIRFEKYSIFKLVQILQITWPISMGHSGLPIRDYAVNTHLVYLQYFMFVCVYTILI